MTTPTQPSHPPNPGVIFESLSAYQRTAALNAAIELDIFTAIAKGNHTADTIAASVSASVRGVRILCDFLVIHGMLTKEGGEYSLTADSGMFLDKQSPAYLGGISRFLLDPMITAPFASLAEIVRSGRTTLPGEGTVSEDNPVWVEFAEAMAPMMFPASMELAGIVGGGEMKVLDIAAGHGIFGIMVAKQNPQAKIVALDWPNVLAVAVKNAAKFGVADRHATLPGDAFKAEFEGPYDVILVTNFFHHFDPPTCETLMRKILAALAPGGRCITLDFVPNDDRVSPPMQASFAMMMLGSTASGDAYTFAEYQKMFGSAGFASSESHVLQRAPQTVIVSRKA